MLQKKKIIIILINIELIAYNCYSEMRRKVFFFRMRHMCVCWYQVVLYLRHHQVIIMGGSVVREGNLRLSSISVLFKLFLAIAHLVTLVKPKPRMIYRIFKKIWWHTTEPWHTVWTTLESSSLIFCQFF